MQEAYRHHKTVALSADAGATLGIEREDEGVTNDPATFLQALGLHRHWNR